MAYHLLRLARGPAWDYSRGRRDQVGWDEHAAYMDRLADHGVIVLGGPVGPGDGTDAVHVVDAYDEAVRALFGADPWANTLLTIKNVEPWSVWLRAPTMAGLLAG